ncbi:patatin-like phospholipase family protein [Peloplasma aerotolerans]|uniref:Patatin-like phospholipase family protein n=1 Tax=Peloplasma aerotolerans TaxID=3044389 RepID=A0AAW6U9V5_9MOLU|nr:patatin-like phospholipase family protein [Mariniplasma sp. M4Ah]MDI6452296.1 patatin-like phospholipase family protein [Mariniplasma sp. M4Ah]
MKSKVGLALGGGGARGSYQIGVLKALDDAKVFKNIRHISGSSIGAINTLMILGELSFDHMIDLWQSISNDDLYGLNFERFKKDRLGMYSLDEMHERLLKEVPLTKIRKNKIQGFATAAKINKDSLLEQIMIHHMEKTTFHLNKFSDPHRAVLASASIPVLFGSTTIDDTHYVDGGVIDNCPIQPLIDAGCDIIIAVPIDGRFHPKKFKKEDILLIDIETRKLFHTIPYDILDFKPEVVKNKVEYGYQMGNMMIQKLIDLKYLNQRGSWNRPEGHTLISITKDEEKKIIKEVNN